MIQTEGIIFLSDRRPVFQTTDFRSYQTTPFFEDESIDKQGVEGLLKVYDNTLVAGKTQSIKTDIACAVLLLPLVGGVELTTAQESKFVEAGEFCYTFLSPGEQLSVENPYETELVNYLELWFSSPELPPFLKTTHPITNPKEWSVGGQTTDKNNQNLGLSPDRPKTTNDLRYRTNWGKFDLESSKNTLTPLLTTGWIGKYDGRQDETLALTKPTNCFVFIINGVFEVQNRLLEPRDSLLLLQTHEVEFEALANDSILLIIASQN